MIRTNLNKKLNASTIIELLVTIIIAGILFVLIFDGYQTLRRYARPLDLNFQKDLEYIQGHQIIENMFYDTDSIISQDSCLLFYQEKKRKCQLFRMEHCLILDFSLQSDTLFKGLVRSQIVFANKNTARIDSLLLFVPMHGDTVQLNYGLPKLIIQIQRLYE